MHVTSKEPSHQQLKVHACGSSIKLNFMSKKEEQIPFTGKPHARNMYNATEIEQKQPFLD